MKIQNKSIILRRTAVFYAIVLIIMHILFTALSVITTYIDGNVAQQGTQKILEIISVIFSAIIVYFRFGVLLSVYHASDANTSLPFSAIAIFSFLISHVSQVVINACSYAGYRQSLKYYILSECLSFLIETAVLLILFMLSRSKKEKQRKPYFLFICASVLTASINLIQNVFMICRFFVEINEQYGSTEITNSELFSIIQDLSLPVILGIAGVFIMILTRKLIYCMFEKERINKDI